MKITNHDNSATAFDILSSCLYANKAPQGTRSSLALKIDWIYIQKDLTP